MLHTDVSLPPCEGTHQGKLNSTLPSSITLPGNCEAFFVPYAERQASLQILVSRSLTSQQYNSWSSATKSSSQLTLYLRCHYGTCLCSSMLSGKRGCSVGLSKTCQEERIEDLSSGFPLPRISLSPTSTPKSHLTAEVGRREWGSALRFLFSLFTTAYTLMVSVLSSGTTWFFIFCYSPWSQKAWHSIPGVLCSLRPWDSEKKIISFLWPPLNTKLYACSSLGPHSLSHAFFTAWEVYGVPLFSQCLGGNSKPSQSRSP